MPVTLDGHSYYVFQNSYEEEPAKFSAQAVGLTGATLWSELAGTTEKRYRLVLLLSVVEVPTLEESFAKPGALDFVDERGVHRDPHVGGGVLFSRMGAPKPLAPTGWSSQNRFTVDVELLVERAGA